MARLSPALRLTLLFAATTLPATPLSAAKAPPPVYVPDAEAENAPVLQGETWVGEAATWRLWLKRLDAAERLAYIEGQTGLATDPFAAPPGGAPGFLSFLVVVENRGDAGLSFNPMSCWLLAERTARSALPLALSDLGFAYRLSGRELPVAYERIRPVLLESPRIVDPGARVSGLLVYRALDPRTKRFRLDFHLALPGGDVAGFSAPYRRLKKGERASEEQ